MLRFPDFLRGNKERRTAKKLEKEMSMRGWEDDVMSKPHIGINSQRHMPYGIGHHPPRSTITRGRGQSKQRGIA
jgi:hypothetical protein